MVKILAWGFYVIFTVSATAQVSLLDPVEEDLLQTKEGHIEYFGAIRVVGDLPVEENAVVSAAAEAAALLSEEELFSISEIDTTTFVATVTEEGYERLTDSGSFNLQLDYLAEPLLVESVSASGAKDAWTTTKGSGQLIAVLDTGIDSSHPAFVGKINTSAEACFSTSDPRLNSASLCPNGLSEQRGPGAAQHCGLELRGCDHGAHVASIAAGSPFRAGSSSLSGIAPEATIVPIQVFSRITGPACGLAAQCVLSWGSDQRRALQHILDEVRVNNRRIVAVNMSLGSGRHLNNCDGDFLKPLVDRLLARGVNVVVAAGNNGFSNAIARPACISSTISVGAVNDTTGEISHSFSNRSEHVTILAPGETITAAVPGGHAPKRGTSMAAPHVAGALALMAAANPSLTAAQRRSSLLATAGSVLDPVTQRRYRTLNASAAVATNLASGRLINEESDGELAEISGADYERLILPPSASTSENLSHIIEMLSAAVEPGETIEVSRITPEGEAPEFSILAPSGAISSLEGANALQGLEIDMLRDSLSSPFVGFSQ